MCACSYDVSLVTGLGTSINCSSCRDRKCLAPQLKYLGVCNDALLLNLDFFGISILEIR